MCRSFYFDGAASVAFRKIGNIGPAQDGAAFGGYLFHLNVDGRCQVYSMPDLSPVSSFTLGNTDIIVPHSNAVCFGSERYAEEDEFPLLYTNVYNNYQSAADRREGMLCAYRLTRQEERFSARLVQLIRIGFVAEPQWRSVHVQDARPYGNFVIDTERHLLHAFVMRDEERLTRFFTFRLPALSEGEVCGDCGVQVVTLRREDILSSFDEEYVHYMQGAACAGKYIYSVEGFDAPSGVMPAFRVFDTASQKQALHAELAPLGLTREPEFVDVYDGRMLYADCTGDLYEISFKG